MEKAFLPSLPFVRGMHFSDQYTSCQENISERSFVSLPFLKEKRARKRKRGNSVERRLKIALTDRKEIGSR